MFARVSDDPEALKEAERLFREAIELGAGESGSLPQPTSLPPERASKERLNDLEDGRRNIRNRTALMILELASHTLVLGLALASLWLIHLILETLLGKDAKFFSFVPISWIIDTADLLIIGKFLWEIIKDFRRD